MDNNHQPLSYRVPEKSILTGQLAKKIQIVGRLELELGEIAACLGLGIFLVLLFLATSFMGWSGIMIVIRMGVIGLIGAGGRMAIFDQPGGMKYADWLWLWYRYRSRKSAGQLDYTPRRHRRARIHRASRPSDSDKLLKGDNQLSLPTEVTYGATPIPQDLVQNSVS